MTTYRLQKGDCREASRNIPDGSVDLVLTDPPYGNMKGKGAAYADFFGDKFHWDDIIAPDELFAMCARILRPNGRCVLFSQEPYTSLLITSAIPAMPFSYRMVWIKDTFGNALGVNKAPAGYFEDVLVFSKNSGIFFYDFGREHPLRDYNKSIFAYIGLPQKQISKHTGSTYNSHYWTSGVQFAAITEKDYFCFIEKFGLGKMPGFMSYESMKAIDDDFKEKCQKEKDAYYEKKNAEYPATFNLPQGKKHKSNVLTYPKDRPSYHPTQKPVALCADIIETYSNAGDVVADLTMGSGSTGVAAIRTGRNFEGIEMDDGHFERAQWRCGNEYLL